MNPQREDRRSPVEPGQDRPVLAVIRRTLSRGGYTVHATSLQYLVDLVDDLTARAEKAEAERDALRAAARDLLPWVDSGTDGYYALASLLDNSPSSAGGKSDGVLEDGS